MASHVTEAFVFDAIRTPRGRGKASGSVHEVKPITLLTGVLKELQKRHDLDTSQVDDVVMGCVTPIASRIRNWITAPTATFHW